MLVQPTEDDLVRAVDFAVGDSSKRGEVPALWDGHAAERIVKIITSHYS
jgi:hypothetical protein